MRGRNLLQCQQNSLRTEGLMMIRNSLREGGKGRTDRSRSKPREQKVQRLKQEDVFGGISSCSTLLLCKVHNGGREDEMGPNEVQALYLLLLKVWTLSCKRQGDILWVEFSFPVGL